MHLMVFDLSLLALAPSGSPPMSMPKRMDMRVTSFVIKIATPDPC